MVRWMMFAVFGASASGIWAQSPPPRPKFDAFEVATSPYSIARWSIRRALPGGTISIWSGAGQDSIWVATAFPRLRARPFFEAIQQQLG